MTAVAHTSTFHLPDLGEGLNEAEIVTWHVSVGDHVVTDQPLVSVETDKAVIEIPAPQTGRVASLHGDVGDTIAVGEVLVEFEPTVDSGTVVGKLEVAPPPATPAVSQHLTNTKHASSPPQRQSRAKMSPRTRRRARELGIDPETITPAGKDSVIQSDDVERAAEALPGTPLRGVRKAMAKRMGDAHARVVPATVTGQVDVHRWREDTKPMLRLVRAIGNACQVEPRLNMLYDDRHQRLMPQTDVHLGIAMDTPDGLFVPVLRDITHRDSSDIQQGIEQMRSDVEARRVEAGELTGQTITLSNFGAVGGLYAQMVVVPPQVAIIGVGRKLQRVVAGKDGITEHPFLPISITFDHRVITGVEACTFLNAMVADLASAG